VTTASAAKEKDLSHFRLFLALSRTPHALLDLATPAMTVLLWLGSIPSGEKIALGLMTAFAGYAAVYALNDVVDFRLDREKIRRVGLSTVGGDLDAVYMRHPMAQGFLRYKEGILWMAGWGVLALTGAYFLNPICAIIFLTACLLESGYCLLLKVSHLRVIISGLVKTSGPLAAVFAVDPEPSLLFLAMLFLWLFFWETGGQNVPNDWTDLEEDLKIGAKTIPVWLGAKASLQLIVLSLLATVVFSLGLVWTLPYPVGFLYPLGSGLAGIFLLLLPGFQLWKEQTPSRASALFNRASYYPLVMLLTVLLSWIF
jgi:4-hydroxybenzoate polyprenyltransferase